MDWYNEPTEISPNDTCLVNVCFDREENCPTNNSCFIKFCINKFCITFY